MNVTEILNEENKTHSSTIGKLNGLIDLGENLVPSINFSSAKSFFSNDEIIEYHKNKYNSLRYSRDGREIVFQLEVYFSRIFNDEYCLILDSGMRAITVAINSYLGHIDKIYLPNEIYRKTRDYCVYLMEIGAIEELVMYENEAIDLKGVSKESLVFLESFSNPHLSVADFGVIEKYKKEVNCKVILDSTFSGLLNHKIKMDFIDIEVQSLTKYVSGYNDVLAGCIVTDNKEDFNKCWDIRSREGGVLDSMSGYLLVRSLRDYDLRIEKQEYNVRKIYEFIKKNKNISKVYFPGKQMNESQNITFSKYYYRHGSVISFVSRLDVNLLSDKLRSFKVIKIAPSFGSIDTLIELPSIMSHFGKNDEYFKEIKLERNLIRLSVGCEPCELIIKDLIKLL